MLKERKCSEYQKRYDEYIKKHKEVENLEETIKRLNREKKEKSASIEFEKVDFLSGIEQRKKSCEDKLASVKKNGEASHVVKEYSNIRLKEIDALNGEVSSLEKKKAAIK